MPPFVKRPFLMTHIVSDTLHLIKFSHLTSSMIFWNLLYSLLAKNKCSLMDMRLDLRLKNHNFTISSRRVGSNARGERFSGPDPLMIKESAVKGLADHRI